VEILGLWKDLRVAHAEVTYEAHKRAFRAHAARQDPPRDVLPPLTAYKTWMVDTRPPQLLRREDEYNYRRQREESP